jgi:hypothetical protein
MGSGRTWQSELCDGGNWPDWTKGNSGSQRGGGKKCEGRCREGAEGRHDEVNKVRMNYIKMFSERLTTWRRIEVDNEQVKKRTREK